jgi:hypothetical protein
MIKARKTAAEIHRWLTGFDYRTRESYWQNLGAMASGRKSVADNAPFALSAGLDRDVDSCRRHGCSAFPELRSTESG